MERLQRLKEQNPGYVGFRGANTLTVKATVALESVVCSVCQRKRNVPSDTLPEDKTSYVCLNCRPDPPDDLSEGG